ADADAPARCAVLRRIVLRPGDAWAQFEHQPFAQNLLAKDGAQAVFAKRDGRIELTAGERLDRDGALARQLAIDSKRGVAAHALGALWDRRRSRPARWPALVKRALEIDAAGKAEVLAVLPERRLAQPQQCSTRHLVVKAPARLDERVDRRAYAQPRIGFEAPAGFALLVVDAYQRLIFLDAAPCALAWNGAGALFALG